jgi:UDP-2,4-diacetamido-2,4,6-trideoxy-beta-L-altropyranose hydrolase
MARSAQPLLIRADAGGSIGTGHVMRMIGLAQAWQDRGRMVLLASIRCPDGLKKRLADEKIDAVKISAETIGSAEDAEATISIAQKIGAEWVVVDGYHFGYEYQKAIKAARLRLLCADDWNYSDRWHCDAILNQNLDADLRFNYENELPDATVLSSSAYCLLRKEFLDGKKGKRTWGRIDSLLVTLGGSDVDNATEATLRLIDLACERPLQVRVLAGGDNPHYERLCSYESHHHIDVIRNATNMPEQYNQVDGVISAGGSTCWEWLYWGLPGAIVTLAENQLPIVKALASSRNAALSLGWFNESTFERNRNRLSHWIDAPAEVSDMSIANGLIDGAGADRVANFMLTFDAS